LIDDTSHSAGATTRKKPLQESTVVSKPGINRIHSLPMTVISSAIVKLALHHRCTFAPHAIAVTVQGVNVLTHLPGSRTMIKPKAIDHIVLRTVRYRDLIDFYCSVIGCTVERSLPEQFGLTQLRAGSSLIDIVDVNGELGKMGGAAPQAMGNNVDHFCLQIEAFDEDALKTYLRGNGVEVGEFQQRYGAQGLGRSLYLKDVAGNNLELRAAC
jgi:catechol 2,3-dioxygenase-like lactoylglutathione lyase family enzyme